MTEEKKITIEFAPGAFDSFEGTQEELDALQREVMEMFATLTPEELAARSSPVDTDYIEELMDEDPQAAEQLIRALGSGPEGTDRNLQ
jgi:transcriptional regulator of met regulon